MKKIKVISAGLLVGGVMMSMLPALAATTTASGFSDLSASSTYYNAVMDLKARGIISGYPDGTFKPDQVVNRAEALKLILGAAKVVVPTDAAMGLAGFSDVDGSAWYAPYLRKALSMGVVQGYPDGTFKPGQTVNLAENLKMLIKAENIDLSQVFAIGTPYNDVAPDAWYRSYLEYANEGNLIEAADANGNIHPDQGMTRGKLSELLYRLLFIQDRKLTQFPMGVMISGDVNEPVAFSTTGLDVNVFKDSSDMSHDFNAQELAAVATECGTVHAAGYFDTLMTKMSGKVTTYTFVENKAAQDNMYVVRVMPNNFGYTDEKSFENDFNICAVGGMYPLAMNSKFLLFAGDCGGALDNSGLPQGCGDIKAVVGSSLKLK